MKTVVRRAVTALTVALVCQAGLALAEDIRLVSDDSKPAAAEKAPMPGQSCCCARRHKMCGAMLRM